MVYLLTNHFLVVSYTPKKPDDYSPMKEEYEKLIQGILNTKEQLTKDDIISALQSILPEGKTEELLGYEGMIELTIEVPENKDETLIIDDKDQVDGRNAYFVEIDDFCVLLYKEGYNKGEVNNHLSEFSGNWSFSLPKSVWKKVFALAE